MNTKLFSVLICCYGDFPDYTLRSIRSVLEGTTPEKRQFEFHIGTNTCSERVMREIHALHDAGQFDTLIESRENLNKDPMFRLLLQCMNSEYFLWMDDDSYVMPGWDDLIARYIRSNRPFDAAGILYTAKRYLKYKIFLHNRPWFVSDERFYLNGSQWTKLKKNPGEVTIFPTGGLYIGRRDFFLRHNFPDKAIVKRADDMLLGDLFLQQNGKLLMFPPEMCSVLRCSMGDRRGQGEKLTDLSPIDPVTGFRGEAARATLGGFAAAAEAACAEQRIEEAAEPNPGGQTSPQTGDEAGPAEDPVILNQKGNALFGAGDISGALELYQRAAICAPTPRK